MITKIPADNVKRLVAFIVARHAIYIARSEGKPKPWTKDPILRSYRFCNVYRELDTVTQWISNNWREPLSSDPDLWFAMAVARWVNWPDTLAELQSYGAVMSIPNKQNPLCVRWDPESFITVLHRRKELREKVWTGAYMIGTQGNAMDKAEFIAMGVLNPLWQDRKNLRPYPGTTLAAFAQKIINVKNQGSFMVGQIVADAKYADPNLMVASDWDTWAVSGPGSRRGLNRVVGNDLKGGWREPQFLETLTALRSAVNSKLPPWMEALHAQDLQNCLCEFDKYERVRLGQGKPRSLYRGAA